MRLMIINIMISMKMETISNNSCQDRDSANKSDNIVIVSITELITIATIYNNVNDNNHNNDNNNDNSIVFVINLNLKVNSNDEGNEAN